MRAFYLLDTVIIIDHLNGIPAATEWLESDHREKSAISVITRAEVLTGAKDDEQEQVERLLASFECLSITPAVADRAAKLRRKYQWKLPDAFQAALAANHRLELVTRNTKDFSPEKHSFVIVPYTL